MPVSVITGNIFTSECQTLVNTVNCVGVMGAGIALECRLRYPNMYARYVELCEQKKLDVGLLWLFRGSDRWILNFPTKKHWKYPSKLEYLRAGLEKFVDSYAEREIDSIAFPLLGADRGGIDRSVSQSIMLEYLEGLPITVEIYRYDPSASDDTYEGFKNWLTSNDFDHVSTIAGIRKPQLRALMEAVSDPSICQLNQLLRCKGVGLSTLEKIFRITTESTSASLPRETRSLFDD